MPPRGKAKGKAKAKAKVEPKAKAKAKAKGKAKAKAKGKGKGRGRRNKGRRLAEGALPPKGRRLAPALARTAPAPAAPDSGGSGIVDDWFHLGGTSRLARIRKESPRFARIH